MSQDVIEQLRRENPLPQDLPPLPIEVVLRRIDADGEPAGATGVPRRRRTIRLFPRLLAQGVALAAAAAAVVLVIEHGPSVNRSATASVGARSGLTVFERPQTARDRTLPALISYAWARSGPTLRAHSGALIEFQPVQTVPSLDRYVETLPDGREVFLSVMVHGHDERGYPSRIRGADRTDGALPALLTIVQPDGSLAHGQPVTQTGIGFVDSRVAASEARDQPPRCVSNAEWSLEPNDVARVRWQFPRQDVYGYVYKAPLTVDIQVHGNLAIAPIPGRPSCEEPSVVTLYDSSGHVIHRTGNPANLDKITMPVRHRTTLHRMPTATHTSFPKNASGQTYGSAASVLPSQEPDLVSVSGQRLHGSGHVHGYILKSELNAHDCGHVKNPKAAVRCTKANAGKTRKIPVYARNGKTIIGTFTVPG